MRWIFLLIGLVVISGCGAATVPVTTETTSEVSTTTTTTIVAEELARTTQSTEPPPPLALSSPAFSDGGVIPARHTCDGEDIAPPLHISGLPAGTKSLIIIVEDPDASVGSWDHWVEFDIPASPGSMDIPESHDTTGVDGRNSWHVTGYMGPCPPEGEEHRYFFTVYALSGKLGLPAKVSAETVRSALESLVIDSAELMGVFTR